MIATLLRGAVVAAVLATGCSRPTTDSTDPDTAVTLTPDEDDWLQSNLTQIVGLDEAIEQIVEAVERNDMGRFGDSPERCASSAAALAPAAAGALDDQRRAAFAEVAAACARIAGPARAFDSAGVMSGLESLFVATALLTPVLDAGRAFS